MCVINLVSFVSVPSNAARHHGGAGFLGCEAVVPGAAVKGTFLWTCVYDVSLRHCCCLAKRLVSAAVSRPDKLDVVTKSCRSIHIEYDIAAGGSRMSWGVSACVHVRVAA